MAIGLRAAVVLFAILTCGVASADVVVRVQVVEGPVRAEDAAAADDGPGQAETLLSIETLARPGGAFRSRTEVGGRIVELKGSLKPGGERSYTVAVAFSSKGPDGGQEVTTNLLVTIGKPVVLAKLVGAGRERSALLTIVEDGAGEEGPPPE